MVKGLPKIIMKKVLEICRMSKEIAQDDPRKVIHSLKVGLAISLVSLFYYYQPLYENFGLSAMWAVMTVVVVFEYTVGATLGKGLNRTMATLAAGALGVGAHYLASLSGETGEPILIGFFVFVQAAIASFIRFFPEVKTRYDYGMLIFILTFSLISVSGFRDDEVLEMAHKRLTTIFIGGSACVMISIFVCPVWAGEELHYSIALKLEKLGDFLEVFVGEYFKTSKEEEEEFKKDSKKSFLEGYKSILNSKSNEESLANFARWEPGHGKFKFRHPWGQYLRIGALSRQCAYRMEALNEHLNSNTQESEEIRCKIQELCSEMSLECSMALKEMGSSIRRMRRTYLAETHIKNSKAVVKRLKSLLQSSLLKESADLLSVIPAVTVASLLINIVECTEEIADSVNVLATLINFDTDDDNDVDIEKSSAKEEASQSQSQSELSPTCECEPGPNSSQHVVILVDQDSSDSDHNRGNSLVYI